MRVSGHFSEFFDYRVCIQKPFLSTSSVSIKSKAYYVDLHRMYYNQLFMTDTPFKFLLLSVSHELECIGLDPAIIIGL